MAVPRAPPPVHVHVACNHASMLRAGHGNYVAHVQAASRMCYVILRVYSRACYTSSSLLHKQNANANPHHAHTPHAHVPGSRFPEPNKTITRTKTNKHRRQPAHLHSQSTLLFCECCSFLVHARVGIDIDVSIPNQLIYQTN